MGEVSNSKYLDVFHSFLFFFLINPPRRKNGAIGKTVARLAHQESSFCGHKTESTPMTAKTPVRIPVWTSSFRCATSAVTYPPPKANRHSQKMLKTRNPSGGISFGL